MDILKDQLKVLLEDHQKTSEKLNEIRGAIKVVEHLISVSEKGVQDNGNP